MSFLPRVLVLLFCFVLTSCVHYSPSFTQASADQLRINGWPELQSRYLIRFSGGTIAAGSQYLSYMPFALSLSAGIEAVVRVELEGGSKVLVVLGHDGDNLTINSNGVVVSIPSAMFDKNGNVKFKELVGDGFVLFKGVSIYVKPDIAGIAEI